MPEFINYLKAGYPALWVQTHEDERAVTRFSGEAGCFTCYNWDLISGIKEAGKNVKRPLSDPRKALEAVLTLPEASVLFLKDFHKFIGAIDIIRTLKNLLPELKATNRHIVFPSPVVQIPVELQKDIIVMDFPLPAGEELVELAKSLVESNERAVEIDPQVIQAARGLTLDEAENALALSLLTEKTYSRSVLENQKLQIVKKSGLMELYRPVPESELGGYFRLKKYVRNRKRGFEDLSLPAPQGVLMVGLPGTGKTLAAKVIASVLDFPLLRLDIAALKGSLVGQSEENMRRATALIDAVSPCVVLLDELEKAFSGVQSSGKTDGGTSSAIFGQFLTWTAESTSLKYIVATCNGIEELMSISQGALLRAGRFDDIFYLDLPTEEERKAILKIMNHRYRTEVPEELTQRMVNWTGAEIEKFVKASIYDGIEEAFDNLKPLYEQNQANIERTREWARLNARLANGEEDAITATKKRTGRKIA